VEAGGAVGVPDAELEQLLKGMTLYNLNVHKVGSKHGIAHVVHNSVASALPGC
jgi:hypothetical protein